MPRFARQDLARAGVYVGTHVYRHEVEFYRLAFADVFVPALAFTAGVSVAFGAFAGVLRRIQGE